MRPCVRFVFVGIFALTLFAIPGQSAGSLAETGATNDCWTTSTGRVYVPETGHHIAEPFLSAWRAYDLSIVGYPVSEPLEVDGMTVQYFERARFERHPEHAGTEYEVLLTLLGNWISAGHEGDPEFAPLAGGIDQPDPHADYYSETGHYLQTPFRDYWRKNGGLPVFGYPISEMLIEDGYLVQYFERARFERHPEHAGTPYEIQLGHLGRELAAADGIDQQPVPQAEDAVDFRADPEPRSYRIPVLMYHRFGAPAERYTVTYWDFEQQLIWLRDNGYTPITMLEAYNGLFGGAPLPEKPAILTFDDGWPSQWRAAEILDQYGFKGVFFVHPDRGMAPEQFHDLAARGHEIGSHSYTHPALTTVPDEQLWREVHDSRDALAAITGANINFFAYPYGNWDERVIAAVKAAGYCGAVHAWDGQQWTPEKRWIEPRVEISGTLTLSEFAALIDQSYQRSERPTGFRH